MTHTIERVRVAETPSTRSSQPPRRSLHISLVSTTVLLGLVSAVVLLLMAISSDTQPQIESPADNLGTGIPMSADAAERYFAGLERAGVRAGVPMSADAAERHFAGLGS